jgi:hypothetical protein
MVSHLDLAPGMRVLEVTDGTTQPSERLQDQVRGGSIDAIPVGQLTNPDVVLRGLEVAGDPSVSGCTGYDRVLVSVPMAVVPYALVEAVREGGTLVVPWANPFAGPSVARLTIDDDRAYGRFVEPLTIEDQRAEGGTNVFDVHADTLLAGAPASCGLDPDALWSDRDALFALGIQLPDLRFTQAEFPDGSGRVMRWVYDQEAWAGVSVSADGDDPRWEHYGLPTLWGTVEKAHRWWVDSDRPAPDQFGMTVASYGQFGWLGDRYSGRMWRL